MMQRFRKILYPISLLYDAITHTRNTLYDKGFIASVKFDIPIISVGNLRVGGTGKTPQIAYLIALLKSQYRVAVLSRGYKRKSKGFVLGKPGISAYELGDESYQLLRRYPDIMVAVDADRVHGITTLLALENPPELILLDDAMQHRKVKAGLNILLTPYDDLYVEDHTFPSGNLRESIKGAQRAELIVVTKCPDALTEEEEFKIAVKLQPTLNQTIFFSKIRYANHIVSVANKIAIQDLKAYSIVLLTGIANPKPFLAFLKNQNCSFKHMAYPDHYNYTSKDIQKIQKEYDSIENKNKVLLTTEKDYVRIFASLENIYYLAIETEFINHQKDFDTIILDYVEKNTGNRKIS